MMGDGFDRKLLVGGYRGEELLDAVAGFDRAWGALGARLRLCELRLE